MGIFSAIGNFGVGALKGLGSTVSTVGEIGEKGIRAVLPGMRASDVQLGKTEKDLANLGVENAFTPTTKAQKVGFAAEQIGEFFIPGGAARAGAVKVGAKVSPAISAAARAGVGATKGQRALIAGTKLAGESAGQAAVSLAQTGDVKEAGATGAINAVVSPAISKGLPKAASYLRENVSPRIINSLVKPLSKEFEFGRNAGRGVVREGIKAATRGGLLKKITGVKKSIGKQIDQTLRAAPKGTKIDIEPALTAVRNLVRKANKEGNTELAEAIKRVEGQITNVYDPATGAILRTRNPMISPVNARKLKTAIGNSVRWHNQAFDNDINQARVAAYRAIRNAISKAVPDVAELNSRYADIFSAERSAKRIIDLSQRSNLAGLLPGLAGGAATIASGFSPEGLVKGALAAGAVKLAGSTGAKTFVEEPLIRGAARALEAGSKSAPAVSGLAGKLTNLTDSNSQSQVTDLEKVYPQYVSQIRQAREAGIPDNEIASYLQQKAQ